MSLEDALNDALGADYDIESELGGGGMSRVFVAHDRALNRRVVIKVLAPSLAATVSTDRFEREILIAAGLQHPNIVPIITAGTADGLPFLVMPFVEGESLHHRLKLAGALSIKEGVNVFKDVARALAFAHARGIIHRDIKPDNILLSAGVAMLADFGVAKAVRSAREQPVEQDVGLTRVGTSLGTPTYMAPEQATADEATDHRADIYALGITVFEMLTGQPPFSGSTPTALIASHLTETPARARAKRPEIPEWLDDLIARCLAKDPADRPASADDIVAILEEERGGIGVAPRTVNRTQIGVMMGVILAAVVGLIVGIARLREPDPAATTATIGVLPFVNVSGNPEDEYFADGLTDELISALGRIPDVRVASRTGTYAFKGSDAGVAAIGTALNVSTLLEGTVRRGGDRLRLNAQLVNVHDGLTLWSQTYERELHDVFEVQDELTASIVGALQERIGAPHQAVTTTRATTNIEAYDLYLRGRYFFARRGEESIRQALRFFQEAVALDTNFAAAYTGIADAYGLLPLYGSTPGDSVLPLAIAAADQAIARDSTLATAYASRANLYNSAWRWNDAERDYRRALALDDRYATAHQWFGEHLLVRGRIADAVSELSLAAQLDPLSPIINASYGTALGMAGQAEAAIARGHRAIELDSMSAAPRFMVGATWLYLGQPDSAVPQLEVAARLAPNVAAVHGLLGFALARTGKRERARAILASVDRADLRTGNGVAIARLFLGLQQPDSALIYLDLAAKAHDPFFASESMASTIFDPIRDRREFSDVVDQIGLDVSWLGNR